MNLIALIAGVVIGMGSNLGISAFSELYRTLSSPIDQAHTLIKNGDAGSARELLEQQMANLDLAGIEMLAEMYVSGLGGVKDDGKAAGLLSKIRCFQDAPGQMEFKLYKNLTQQGSSNRRALSWLLKSAELGNLEAISALADADQMRHLEVAESELAIENWRLRLSDGFVSKLEMMPDGCIGVRYGFLLDLV
jgi:hypothetical protein